MAWKRRPQNVEENRGRDVVRHVPHDNERTARELGDIDVEDVLLDDGDVPVRCVPLPKLRRERPIDLDCDELVRPGRKDVGERSPARPNLDYDIAVSRRSRCRNCVENPSIAEEVLTELLEDGRIAALYPQRINLSSGG